jgi:hypothetical protein
LEERFVRDEFFRRACNADGDFLYDARFDGNIDFDSGENVFHITFLKSVGGRDRVIEPVVVGKSACGQVDRPLRFDLNPRQKSAYHGH